VRNVVFNEHRRRRRAWLEPLEGTVREGEGPERELPDSSQKTAAREVLDRELMGSIDRAIRELPEAQRLAVILRRYDEFSYEEIAEVLKTSVPAVKSLLFRAREELRVKLQKYLGDESGV
jgi:RNA polymerase sigma-70 factor (ECF subfamily)